MSEFESKILNHNFQIDSKIYWNCVEKHLHTYGDLYTSYLACYHAKESNLKLIEELYKVKCKKIENEGEIFIIDNKKKKELSIKLMKNLTKRQVKEFRLVLPPTQKNTLNSFKYFARNFSEIAGKVTDMIQIKSYRISRKFLPRILSSASHISNLIFYECSLDTSNIKFPNGIQYRIETLNLTKCGMKECSDWKNNPSGLDSILKAVSKCSLKKSLRTILLHFSGLEIEEIQKMIEANELKGIIIKGSISSFYSTYQFTLPKFQ
ncbi:unnamed protein product [Moneuplotes crassus]|uniref:Uncharacterized protein n=1 Tax=Euplotes crassus TaxID=5936 RepID=A0AAD1XTZ5_EUPCR|nr:unnamed protein product [Moneuplotes crassus]